MFSRSSAAAEVHRSRIRRADVFAQLVFHACGDFFMFQHFATIDLRQSFFDLADEPFVVIRQTLNCLMHQRFSVASLLRGNAVKLGLQLWRKVYFHAARRSVPPSSVKAFAT